MEQVKSSDCLGSTVWGGTQNRWFARRLDGPGAEPLGKDFKARRTSWSEMLGGEGVGSGGMGGGGDWGCFVSICSTVGAVLRRLTSNLRRPGGG